MPAEAASHKQVALLLCSRTESTLRAPKGLRPCWTDFFKQALSLKLLVFLEHESELFNKVI